MNQALLKKDSAIVSLFIILEWHTRDKYSQNLCVRYPHLLKRTRQSLEVKLVKTDEYCVKIALSLPMIDRKIDRQIYRQIDKQKVSKKCIHLGNEREQEIVLKLVFIKVGIQGTQGYVFMVGWNTEHIGNSIEVSIH